MFINSRLLIEHQIYIIMENHFESYNAPPCQTKFQSIYILITLDSGTVDYNQDINCKPPYLIM